MTFWNNKIVVVTGGSTGLGKAIVESFARQGSTVVLLARKQERNAELTAEFDARGLRVSAIKCDVSEDQQVSFAITQVIEQHGRIDVWVNCVGASTRVDIRDAGVDVYTQQMDSNFYSAVRCANKVLEYLEKSSGHLVNIGSLASKTAWPFMAPYAASKHALAAYTQQLRIEGPKNVHYLLVCPGPIRRDDSGQRYTDQTEGLPAAASQPGGGANVSLIDPDWMAAKICRACQKRKPELVVPWKSRLLFSIAQLSPRLGDWLLKKFQKP